MDTRWFCLLRILLLESTSLLMSHCNPLNYYHKQSVKTTICQPLKKTNMPENGANWQVSWTIGTDSPAAGLTSGGDTQTGSITFVLMDKILLWYLWIMKIHDDIAGNLCELKYSRFYKHIPPKTCNFHIWLRIIMKIIKTTPKWCYIIMFRRIIKTISFLALNQFLK